MSDVCSLASGDLSRLRLAQVWEPEQRAVVPCLAAARLSAAFLRSVLGKMSFIPREEMTTALFSQRLADFSSRPWLSHPLMP